MHPHQLVHQMSTRPEAGEVARAAPCASVCKYSKYCDWMHTEGPIAADLSAEQVLKGWR